MSQEKVRCPYCVSGSEFRPMFRRSKGAFVCVGCDHRATPGEPHSKCPCSRCRKLNRIAGRLSREYNRAVSTSVCGSDRLATRRKIFVSTKHDGMVI
jgi:hypothetical protein